MRIAVSALGTRTRSIGNHSIRSLSVVRRLTNFRFSLCTVDVVVSGTIVGMHGAASTMSEHFVDGSQGQDVRLSFPTQIAQLDERTLVIVDSGANMVRLYDIVSEVATSLAGKFQEWGSYEGPDPLDKPCFNQPYGVAVIPGKVYVSNYDGHTISRINMDKESRSIEIVAGSGIEGSLPEDEEQGPALGNYLYHPAFLSIDNSGNLAITNYYEIHKLVSSLQHGDPKSGRLFNLGRGVSQPMSIAFNRQDGTEIVSSRVDHCLYRTQLGNSSFPQQSFGAECGEGKFKDGEVPFDVNFNGPAGVIWSPGGEVLFIADAKNNRIRYMPHDLSFVATLAGNGIEGNKAGSGDEAMLVHPIGLALMNNSLFFSQYHGHDIRKIG